jgi:hypothetical protein
VIIVLNLPRSGPPADHATLEEHLISQLNDCVWPRDRVPIAEYPPDFVEAIEGSEFIAIEGDYFTIKNKRKSLFCRLIAFADLHPDLAGLIVFFAVAFAAYGFYVYQKARARLLIPSILQTVRNSQNRMCFIDDVRRRLEADGVSTFWTWRFIVPMVNRAQGVRRVEVKYSKPFWSVASD